MATLQNGGINGHTNGYVQGATSTNMRFSDIPSAIDIPVQGLDAEEAVEVNLEELLDDPTELCTLLENEGAARSYWMVISLAYAKQNKVDHAIELLIKGLAALGKAPPKEKMGLLSCLCWMYLWKSRQAPRTVPEGELVSEARTKDYYLQASTATLNDASRINPSFPPLFLARGVLYLLRASLQQPSKAAPGTQEHSERVDTLRQALKSFEDALRVSSGRNMMAVLGKARAQFSLGRYAEALHSYQEVLSKMPDLREPDPRIGVGCCFWQLGFKDEARGAWERALELDPDSAVANLLVGVYFLDSCSSRPTSDPTFMTTYKKAMTQYIQKAYKLGNDLPMTCAVFAGYFLSRKSYPEVERLAKKAIEFTDVNATASDGWYLLGRVAHYQDDISRASDFYQKADQARGGADKGYLPAKFGTAQLQVLMQDIDGAKFRLEKVVQQSKNYESMALLGALYADEVFANHAAGNKEDKSSEARRAISLLETVRAAWKDTKKHISPDVAVLVMLARLYEADHSDKSLQCLEHVERIELDKIPEEERPQDIEGDEAMTIALRESLTPQLLNNIGCFHYQGEKYDQARQMFQSALGACVRAGEHDVTVDTDALVTTVSYNLARTYEAAGLPEEAKKVYEGLLERHGDYTDANTRLAYIALRQSPAEDGPKMIAALYQTDSTDLEVRALYGWYLHKAKKRTPNIAEDQEQRHFKHTLQNHDKHDRYALTGMGNLYLTTAREMPRDTDSEKEKRRRMFERGVEFFEKALQIDPKNAFAAQGVAIALAEDKKEFGAAVQLFSKVRETVKEASVYINLGHVYTELKQYSKAIESYEAALAKDRAHDPQVLACLGRVWMMRGRHEKSIQAMKSSLEYSQRALEIAPDQIHFQFNVAFVQIQLAQLIYSLSETQRTLQEVEAAAAGLDEAIESFTQIAQHKSPPYPKNMLEQRANMGRNTMRRQLERAITSQREYEEKNAAKLQQAREIREAELKRREAEKRKAAEEAEEQRRRIKEERQKILEADKLLAEERAEEDRKREEAEWTVDEETGERRKKKKRGTGGKRKKKDDDIVTDDDLTGDDGRKSRGRSEVSTAEEGAAPKKRRRLERKRAPKDTGKFKSSEIVVESSDEEDLQVNGDHPGSESPAAERTPADDPMEEDEETVPRPRKKIARRIEESDDEDDDGAMAGTNGHGGDDEAMADAPPTPGVDEDDE